MRRKLVDGSLEVYPIKDYGAIESGAHQFCHLENGKDECGTFRFVHLWLAICWTWGIAAAQVCSCPPSSPEEGFDRAQYVFTGKVVNAEHHVWLVAVERVWKGHEKLRHTIKLMDVYARMDCEFSFELGERYVFFAVLAKGSREVFYHPQACNWTRRLQSTRVLVAGNESLLLEDSIVRQHGPGEPPGDAPDR